MPNKKLWTYISRLEKVIKTTMESSVEISALVEKIQCEGIEVSLNCIALFSDPKGRSFTGPNAERVLKTQASARKKKARKAGTRKGAAKPKSKRKPEFRVTDADREFLRQIGIRFD